MSTPTLAGLSPIYSYTPNPACGVGLSDTAFITLAPQQGDPHALRADLWVITGTTPEMVDTISVTCNLTTPPSESSYGEFDVLGATALDDSRILVKVYTQWSGGALQDGWRVAAIVVQRVGNTLVAGEFFPMLTPVYRPNDPAIDPDGNVGFTEVAGSAANPQWEDWAWYFGGSFDSLGGGKAVSVDLLGYTKDLDPATEDEYSTMLGVVALTTSGLTITREEQWATGFDATWDPNVSTDPPTAYPYVVAGAYLPSVSKVAALSYTNGGNLNNVVHLNVFNYTGTSFTPAVDIELGLIANWDVMRVVATGGSKALVVVSEYTTPIHTVHVFDVDCATGTFVHTALPEPVPWSVMDGDWAGRGDQGPATGGGGVILTGWPDDITVAEVTPAGIAIGHYTNDLGGLNYRSPIIVLPSGKIVQVAFYSGNVQAALFTSAVILPMHSEGRGRRARFRGAF